MGTLVTAAMVGRECTFQSLNPNDTTTYIGTIESDTISARLAARDQNLPAYNSAVRQVDSSVDANVDNLSYFNISIADGTGGAGEICAFAEEWVAPGTFQLTDQLTEVDVSVLIPDTVTPADVLAVIRNAGWQASLLTS